MNWPDLLLLAIIVACALLALPRGFARVTLELSVLAFSVTAALLLLPGSAALLARYSPLPASWREPVAFVGVWLAAQLIVGGGANKLLLPRLDKRRRPGGQLALALLPGAMQGMLVAASVLTTLALLPGGSWRDSIQAAGLAGPLVRLAEEFEQPIERAIGPAVQQTVSLLAAPATPASNETIALGFTVSNPAPQQQAEEQMLAGVNAARLLNGLQPLVMDGTLQRLARAYGAELLGFGYFSHTDRARRSPFDRMRDAGIRYTAAGENLALAPDAATAQQGLLNSPSHRSNILNPRYSKVGIGAVGGGPDGIMFVQEFSD